MVRVKVALVYDRVNKWGGAERVLLALHKLFPDAPLFTSVYNLDTAPWARIFDVKTSFLQNFPGAKTSHEYFPLLMPIAFEQFNFDEFDLVISVTSESAKGIVTKPHTKHICYCLTPTRYLWSGYNQYFKDSILKTLATPAVTYLRTWDKAAAERPDTFFAISKEVQKRIKVYYQRDSDLVYPPVYSELSPLHINNYQTEDFFLIVSRLVPYKRVDIAIEACNTLQLPLKIVGVGSEEKKLKHMAGKTIEFLGSLTDDELSRYYKKCKALIFPGHEDFGLTMVEAQSFGKPVLAYKEGGALETVIEGVTGEFFTPQTSDALIQTLQYFMQNTYDPQKCHAQANEFTEGKFNREFMRLVEEFLEG